MIGIIRGKGLRAVEEGVDTGLGQHRHTVAGGFQDRLEVVEVFRQLVEFKGVRDAVHRPGFGVWLKCPQQDLTRIFLVIRTFVRHPQDRHLGEALNAFGDDVKMLAGVQRDVDARHPADLVAPHAGAVHHHVGLNVTLGLAIIADPVDTSDATAIFGDTRDLDPLLDQRAALAGAFGESQRDVCGITLTVLGQPYPAGNITNVQMLVAVLDLSRRDFLDIDAKRARHGGLTEYLFLALFGQGHGDRTATFEARGDAGFCLQRAVEFLTVFRQLGHVGGRAQLGDQARGVPSGAGSQLLALQQNHILPAQLGQMIGHRTSDHTTADNDHAGLVGKIAHLMSPDLSLV